MKPIRLILTASFVFVAITIALSQSPTASPVAKPPGSPSAASPVPPIVSAAAARSDREQKAVGKKFSSGWGEKLHEGGNTAIVQLLLSVFGATFAFERFFNLRRKNYVPKGLTAKARELWNAGKFDELERIDETDPSTLGRAIALVAQNRDSSIADVSAIAGDIISQELELSHQKAYPLGVVATLEPLLGLLGMILGMIQTFETVALAGALGDPAQLAGGISEALVTTGLGLAIAIPFLALFHFFKSRTNMYGSALEREVTALIAEWMLKKGKQEAANAH